jgi:adenine-specific DNA-methyltransferase
MKPRMPQDALFDDPEVIGESREYLSQQLLTYIGNKRSLLGAIENAVLEVKAELGGGKITTFDGFSGSGVVSRMLKKYSSRVTTNDLEDYATVVSRCYLANSTEVDMKAISTLVSEMNLEVDGIKLPPDPGFIERLYSPTDDDNIQLGDRVFYTNANGRRLDHYRQLISQVPDEIRDFLLGPLLSEASVHANTAGVFKGFYKDKETGKGRFGGSGEDALSRIKGSIVLKEPVLSRYQCDYEVLSGDINEVVGEIDEVDLAYFDPPYNQHPYGSNYFLLNLLVNYVEPGEVSQVSGIPKDWTRSQYNVKKKSLESMRDLVNNTKAKYVLISFNDEGFISPDEMRDLLKSKGELREMQIRYNTYRGSRNLEGRSAHVTEHLYLVKCD